MRKLTLAVSAALFLTSVAIAGPPPKDPPAKAKNDSAAQKAYDELKAEFDALVAESRKPGQSAKAPKPDEYAPKFRAIADKYPKEPAAANALAWIVMNRCSASLQAEALDALLANHLASPVAGSVSQSLQRSYAANADTFLEAVIEKSADHEAQGRATYSLAKVLATRADYAGRSKADPGFGKNLEKWYGEAYAKKVASADPVALAKRSAELLDAVVAKFADVKAGNGSLADEAKSDLFELRNLAIGQTAPEITGQDENGKPMKLSDFRGKVVMLDFWGFW